MALPKKKISKARGRKRRAQAFKLVAPSLPGAAVAEGQGTQGRRFCPECNHAKQPHTACPNCGYYKGRSLEIER
jgi:large subunit ribosomal protein L32